MITFNKSIKNDGSEDFRQCMMGYCLKPKEMPIHISKEDVESLVQDKSLTVIFEKGSSLREMTSEIALCKNKSSKYILQMVYLKYHPSYKILMEDIIGGNELLQLFDNPHNPMWGLAADETIETKMEMMLAYSVEPVTAYEIIKIKNYADFMHYQYLAEEWCITYGKDIFDLYLHDGQNTLYVLKRNDAESTPKQYGEAFPKDSYGLSFIAVYVNAFGEIINVTSRWNVLQENDQFLTINELKQLLGKDFAKLR